MGPGPVPDGESYILCGVPENFVMANAFDPYREALVMEHHTIWPEAFEDWSAAEKARVEQLIHASPAEASVLDYVRQHTGFARVISITPEDIERVSVA
jgi:hypothetical protein